MAGEHCEFMATDNCDRPVEIGVDASSRFDAENMMNSNNESPFCVNNGLCYRVDDTSAYFCDCVGNWDGRRCDYPVATSKDGGRLSTGGKFGVVLVVLLESGASLWWCILTAGRTIYKK